MIDLVGKPSSTQNNSGLECWYYERRTIDPVTKKTDFSAQVVFEDGRVTSVNFN